MRRGWQFQIRKRPPAPTPHGAEYTFSIDHEYDPLELFKAIVNECPHVHSLEAEPRRYTVHSVNAHNDEDRLAILRAKRRYKATLKLGDQPHP